MNGFVKLINWGLVKKLSPAGKIVQLNKYRLHYKFISFKEVRRQTIKE